MQIIEVDLDSLAAPGVVYECVVEIPGVSPFPPVEYVGGSGPVELRTFYSNSPGEIVCEDPTAAQPSLVQPFVLLPAVELEQNATINSDGFVEHGWFCSNYGMPTTNITGLPRASIRTNAQLIVLVFVPLVFGFAGTLISKYRVVRQTHKWYEWIIIAVQLIIIFYSFGSVVAEAVSTPSTCTSVCPDDPDENCSDECIKPSAGQVIGFGLLGGSAAFDLLLSYRSISDALTQWAPRDWRGSLARLFFDIVLPLPDIVSISLLMTLYLSGEGDPGLTAVLLLAASGWRALLYAFVAYKHDRWDHWPVFVVSTLVNIFLITYPISVGAACSDGAPFDEVLLAQLGTFQALLAAIVIGISSRLFYNVVTAMYTSQVDFQFRFVEFFGTTPVSMFKLVIPAGSTERVNVKLTGYYKHASISTSNAQGLTFSATDEKLDVDYVDLAQGSYNIYEKYRGKGEKAADQVTKVTAMTLFAQGRTSDKSSFPSFNHSPSKSNNKTRGEMSSGNCQTTDTQSATTAFPTFAVQSIKSKTK